MGGTQQYYYPTPQRYTSTWRVSLWLLCFWILLNSTAVLPLCFWLSEREDRHNNKLINNKQDTYLINLKSKHIFKLNNLAESYKLKDWVMSMIISNQILLFKSNDWTQVLDQSHLTWSCLVLSLSNSRKTTD